nr:MAG TPA: hypothetical protein [Caudoviricetes sp.]
MPSLPFRPSRATALAGCLLNSIFFLVGYDTKI